MKIAKQPEWDNLARHAQLMSKLHMRDFFETDQQRGDRFSLEVGSVFLDYSKNIIRDDTLKMLFSLAKKSKLTEMRTAMFAGEKINNTENKAVLHTALRKLTDDNLLVNDENISQLVKNQLQEMRLFSKKIRNQQSSEFSNQKITDVVNIGIGGSDLGANMVCQALTPYQHPDINLHFMSNIDSEHFLQIVRKLDPKTTLFIIVSKSFNTEETRINAISAKKWFLDNGGTQFEKHFVAVTENQVSAKEFGVGTIFKFWDWVGGRYSLWSSVGLIVMISIGYDNFLELLSGANQMDEHFISADFEQNMPVIMAMLSIWYNNFLNAESHAILPYDENLKLLTPYLEQMEMESNGKSVDRDGDYIEQSTGSILWGSQGINGQHAFYQLLHQSQRIIPTDFIISINTPNNTNQSLSHHNNFLMANFIAQTEALMTGRTESETKDCLTEAGVQLNNDKHLLNMVFLGNNPSNSIMLKSLTPKSLGELIALYEHKVFVQGVIWNLNSYDQWGVELGKHLSKIVLHDLNNKTSLHDSSTTNLINRYKKYR